MDPTVEILGGSKRSSGAYLHYVLDPRTNQYLRPELPPDAPNQVIGDEEIGCQGKTPTAAIVDSGLLSHHPWIQRTTLTAVDFTGRGSEDENGHGTMVGLLFLLTAPHACLASVRVVDDRGSGSRQQTADGINWVVSQGIRVANVSLGSYDDSCKGTCLVCQSALRAGEAGTIVVAASGNRPGATSCPAKAALYHPSGGIIPVGAYDFDRGQPAGYSGDVGKEGFMGPIFRVRPLLAR